MQILVTLPDDAVPGDAHWKIARAVLEAVEPGASTHCLQWPAGFQVPYCEHVRLDVSVEQLPPSYVTVPWYRVPGKQAPCSA